MSTSCSDADEAPMSTSSSDAARYAMVLPETWTTPDRDWTQLYHLMRWLSHDEDDEGGSHGKGGAPVSPAHAHAVASYMENALLESVPGMDVEGAQEVSWAAAAAGCASKVDPLCDAWAAEENYYAERGSFARV